MTTKTTNRGATHGVGSSASELHGGKQSVPSGQPQTTALKIGKYTLWPTTVRAGDKPPFYDRSDIYIQHENGEGMSTAVENIEDLIDRFYGENF